MSTTPDEPHPPQRSHSDSVQGRLEALMRDFRHGAWQPTGLEHRLAELLARSAAGTGSLSAVSIRAAVWEDSMAAVHENGGRFITLLAYTGATRATTWPFSASPPPSTATNATSARPRSTMAGTCPPGEFVTMTMTRAEGTGRAGRTWAR